jgi:hypothetical protein
MKRRLLCILICLFAFVTTAALVTAQEGTTSSPAPSSPDTQTNDEARTSANEDFELNISERRITRNNYEASTTVEAGEESARGLRLRVGVAIGANTIDVLLRNVRGHVRFRASLERVLSRLKTRAANPVSPSP